MSLSDPRLNTSGARQPAPIHTPAIFVDTNALLQKAIRQLPPSLRSDIVLRCDELAHLQISEEAMENAFTQLLQLIVDEREVDSKLFLHITCSKANKPDEGKSSQGTSHFLIQFHTNLSPHAAWMQEAEKRVNSIALLLLPFGGSLLVNQLKNSGCAFVISLPGK